MHPQKSATRWTLAILCAGALWFLYFFGLSRIGLIGPDEPRYAAIARAMADAGDWITPRLWGHPWFEKPALLYWMTATAFKAGSGPELAPRLPVALLSVAFLVAFFLLLRRQLGERAALFAATVLGTSAGWLAYSHVAVPDLPMSVLFSTAMLIILPEITVRRAFIAGIFLGLAILAKGLVPLVLFIPAVWFLRRKIGLLITILLVAFAVAAPWYALVFLKNGAPFYDQFFGKQQFARFLSGESLHPQPFWFYLPVLAAGLFPWTPFALPLFSKRLYRDQRAVFLLAWFAFGFVFFSASRGKLPGYLLPLLPPLAALIGIAIDQAGKRSRTMAGLAAVSAGLLWLVPTFEDALPQALVSGIGRAPVRFFALWLVPVALLAAASALLEIFGRRGLAIAFIAVFTISLIVRFSWRQFPTLDQEISARGPWRESSGSISCIPQKHPFLRYGFDYYAGRELPDCN